MQFIFRHTMALLLLMTVTVAGAKAQKLFFIFAHGQYASPFDANFKDNYSYGLGAEGGIGIGTGKTFLIGTIGYTFFNDRPGSNAGDLTYVPMKIGVRHYLLPGKLIFIHADAGIGTIKNKSKGNATSRFTGDVGAGVKLGPLEVGISYDGFSRSDPTGYASWLAFKAGWRIGL